MKRYILYFLFLILGIVGGRELYKYNLQGFYEINEDTLLKFSIPMTLNTVAIKNSPETEENVGEVFLGKALKQALKQNFNKVSIDYRANLYPKERNDEIQIYLRGYAKFSPPFPDYHHLNIVYLIYPIYYTKYNFNMIKNRDKITYASTEYTNTAVDELLFYDVLAVASKSYTQKLQQAGFNAYYIPQFTDTDNFYYEYDENLKSDVLFIGTKRQYGIADIALKHNLPITIYGPDWKGVAQKDYIDNTELHKYYSSAKIVLNDHRQDMRMYGFINNRVFDVTATGTLLISDYMPEIEEIFGSSVPMYKTEEELVDLINYYLTNDEEREKLAKKAQAITLKYYTHKVIGKNFYDIITKEKQKKLK